jgi:hypothetical protein
VKRTLTVSLLALGLMAPCLAQAPRGAEPEPAGRIKRLAGSVLVDRAGQTLPALAGMALQVGDRIRTGADGMAGITMADDTLLTAGHNSSLLINNFQFNNATHNGNMLATVSKGSLHVVTGLIAKKTPEKVSFKTPSVVLGVRGTEFLVDVPEGRE